MTRHWRSHLDGPLVERAATDYLSEPTLTDVRALARAKTESAINVLAAIMLRETNTIARVTAAKTLLEWGWGKPEQPVVPGASPFEVVNRIERVIVHPPHPTPLPIKTRKSAKTVTT